MVESSFISIINQYLQMIFSKLYQIALASSAFAAQLIENPIELNDTNHVQLASYNYTSGTFNAEFFVHNDGYDKTVFLYYTNKDEQSTPLTALAASHAEGLEDDWELWTTSTKIFQEEGLDTLLNVTFNSINTGDVYSQQLNIKVEQTDPQEDSESAPEPKIQPSGLGEDIDDWLNAQSVDSQIYKAKSRVFDNIGVEGSVPGLVIASPSHGENSDNPDYFYHWIRDAGLTYDAIFKLYEALPDRESTAARALEDYFLQFISASIAEQNDGSAIAGLGEPKFYVGNNSGYQGAWGRPQNDGPAIRAFAILEFVKEYIKKGGDQNYIIDLAWEQPLKKDLDFVASNWTYSNFDLWEEVDSDHFFTKFVQRRALIQGAEFASEYLRDVSTYRVWNEAAIALNDTLSNFVYPIRNIILNSYGPSQRGKASYKDLSVILGVNHAYIGDDVFAPTNEWVLRTAYEIATSFIPVYELSNTTHDENNLPLAPPTGRYPEDVYNGTGSSLANPWFLSNNAFAEYFFTIAKNFQDSGSISVTELSLPFWKYYTGVSETGSINSDSDQFKQIIQSLLGWGDAYLRVVKYYAGEDGHLSEQFDKDSGVIRGARDLTWSYASLVTAAIARANAKGDDGFTASLALLEGDVQ
ncbi:Glucoamylase [Wickerhamomyces ciferrii]|uniref:glucan 1,4-alpha-glucosidase n=1 Tax=Wickerhamomyces ciferrii (strain ATCC 14091 / BCRC 22168 / CBS 111 / JCM 3599 / NBRC 0793 / NRRL Y-1031 F-60-10) TaxID=1206466 RepID=K0KMZ8_WICCF|nr:Glucoamylase [Wickerhamomyces ciferrii]CCH42734.1 Glucoamylase [Wickerhamomyces ciferrii]